MTEDEFSVLSTQDKWTHLEKTMVYIQQMDAAYDVLKRLNPHHPEADKKKEARAVRLDQYQRWLHVKALYSMHRDELANTLEYPKFIEFCK